MACRNNNTLSQLSWIRYNVVCLFPQLAPILLNIVSDVSLQKSLSPLPQVSTMLLESCQLPRLIFIFEGKYTQVLHGEGKSVFHKGIFCLTSLFSLVAFSAVHYHSEWWRWVWTWTQGFSCNQLRSDIGIQRQFYLLWKRKSNPHH